MRLIYRAYPIQVTVLWIGKIKRRQFFPLCSLHKDRVLCRQAPLTGFHPNHVLWHKILPLCIHTRGKFFIPLGHIKLVETRQGSCRCWRKMANIALMPKGKILRQSCLCA